MYNPLPSILFYCFLFYFDSFPFSLSLFPYQHIPSTKINEERSKTKLALDDNKRLKEYSKQLQEKLEASAAEQYGLHLCVLLLYLVMLPIPLYSFRAKQFEATIAGLEETNRQLTEHIDKYGFMDYSFILLYSLP